MSHLSTPGEFIGRYSNVAEAARVARVFYSPRIRCETSPGTGKCVINQCIETMIASAVGTTGKTMPPGSLRACEALLQETRTSSILLVARRSLVMEATNPSSTQTFV